MNDLKKVLISKIEDITGEHLALLLLFLFVLMLFGSLFFYGIHYNSQNTQRFLMCMESNPVESCERVINR